MEWLLLGNGCNATLSSAMSLLKDSLRVWLLRDTGFATEGNWMGGRVVGRRKRKGRGRVERDAREKGQVKESERAHITTIECHYSQIMFMSWSYRLLHM